MSGGNHNYLCYEGFPDILSRLTILLSYRLHGVKGMCNV